jgi:hypothetical protein
MMDLIVNAAPLTALVGGTLIIAAFLSEAVNWQVRREERQRKERQHEGLD